MRGVQRYIPFIMCLGIAAVLWFTREMGKTYEENLQIPVHYVNVPKSVSLVSQVPTTLNYTVEGTGWGLLKHYMFDDDISIDVSSIFEEHLSAVSTKDVRVVASLSEQLKILDSYPIDIPFTFEKIHSKKVPVHVPLSITFDQQYELTEALVIKPDSVELYGSKSMLDTIRVVNANLFEKKRVRESFSDSVELVPLHNVQMSVEKVHIQGAVEKFTEQTITVPITLINVPKNGVAVDLMRDKVAISFLVCLSKAQTYYPSDFEVVADFQKQSIVGLIPVEIVRYPDYVRIVRQDISSVGVIADFIDAND